MQYKNAAGNEKCIRFDFELLYGNFDMNSMRKSLIQRTTHRPTHISSHIA